MLSERDLQELEQAAQFIINVIQRHRVSEEHAEIRRAQFRMFVSERTQDNEKEDRRSKVLKFTKKEIETMPVQYKNLFFTENAVAHIRIKKGNYYEIRCQINGQKITVTSKELATAKKKFIGKLHENVSKTEEIQRNVMTFHEYGTQWLETIKRPTVKQTTYDDYVCTFRVHLFPKFGARDMQSITRTEIQEYLNGLIDAGKSRAAHKQRQILSSIFEYAEIDGIVLKTPVQKIRLPVHESENGKALTLEEETAFVTRCIESNTRSGAAFVLMLCTGIRRAELATVSSDGVWITVISAKQRMGRTLKTRRIPISPRLKRLIPNLDEQIKSLKTLYPNRLARTLKELLPNHHLHELRHTFITRCQERGIPREVVSVWAGHKADNTMTTNVYTHFSETFQIEEIKKFDY